MMQCAVLLALSYDPAQRVSRENLDMNGVYFAFLLFVSRIYIAFVYNKTYNLNA